MNKNAQTLNHKIKKLSNKKKAIIWMLIFSLFSAFIGIFLREAGNIPLYQKVFVRTLITSIVAFFPYISLERQERAIKTPFLFVIRVIAGLSGTFALYTSFDYISLSDANIISKFSAIILILLSLIILKEPLNKIEISSVIIGFGGVMLVSKPSFNSDFYGYLAAISGACFAATAYLSIRMIGSRIHPKAMVFYFAAISSMILLPFAIFNWAPLSPRQLIFVVLAGISGIMTQYGLTFAYSYAPAKEVSIYSYTSVIFSAFYDMLYGVYPDIISIMGYFGIFGASLLLMKNIK